MLIGRMNRALLTGLIGSLLILGGACATGDPVESDPASSIAIERKPWDQEGMTTLTADLARSVRAVRRAWRREPGFRNAKNVQRGSTTRMDQTLRQLDQRTSQLAERVSSGAGFDDTRNNARNINVLLNDLDMQSRGIMTSKWMQEQVRPAMALINQIAAYYGRDALFDPETMQRKDRPEQRR
jgi:hypothetical protein